MFVIAPDIPKGFYIGRMFAIATDIPKGFYMGRTLTIATDIPKGFYMGRKFALTQLMGIFAFEKTKYKKRLITV